MNIKELNEMVRNNQKEELEKTIKEIENNIVCRAKKGFNDINIVTDRRYCNVFYTIDKWMFEPLKEYFEDNGFKVELEEIKGTTKLFDKIFYKAICDSYNPDYFMIIKW